MNPEFSTEYVTQKLQGANYLRIIEGAKGCGRPMAFRSSLARGSRRIDTGMAGGATDLRSWWNAFELLDRRAGEDKRCKVAIKAMWLRVEIEHGEPRWSVVEIAQQLGRSRSAVQRMLAWGATEVVKIKRETDAARTASGARAFATSAPLR